MDSIRFTFNGKQYLVGGEAYNLDRIVLPDGTLLEVENGWIETMPPTPNGLRVISHNYKTAPEQIAQAFRAAVARLAS